MTRTMLLEFDLAGAEWVVVAYLSGDPNMLSVVESGKSPHIVTGALMSGGTEELVAHDHELVGSKTDPTIIERLRAFGDESRGLTPLNAPPGVFLPRSMSIRQAGKKSNHGLNYAMRYRRFALENEMGEREAEPIVVAYRTKAYPCVFNKWHPDIRKEMKDNSRSLTNCFGRKVTLRDEWGQELFMAAYSFKPQSTVFDCCRSAMIKAFRDESLVFHGMTMGAQVHDSVMVQYPVPTDRDGWLNLCCFITVMAKDYMRPQLVYGDRFFRLGCDVKCGVSWGAMKPLSVEEDLNCMVEAIHRVYDASVLQLQKLLGPDPLPSSSTEPQSTASLELPLPSQPQPEQDQSQHV